MATLTLARLITIEDAMAAVMLSAKGASTNGLGDNDTQEPSDDIGARGRAGDLNIVLAGYAEDDYFSLMNTLRTEIASMGYQTWTAARMRQTYVALNALCVAKGLTGVTSLSGFHSYYNYGGGVVDGAAWTGLCCPDFGRGVYYHINGSYMEARNVYSPAVASMGSRIVGSAFVAGTVIDDTKYAGAARLQCAIATRTGTGLVTVIGNGRDAEGVAVTGHSWSVEMSGDGPTTMTPGVTGDICTEVTGITIGAGISAGTVTISAAIPSGRTNPPT